MSKLNGNHIIDESHGEDLVSYIYGDMPAERQTVFEAHLLDCDLCTTELAMFSDVRLGVIEWRREEFEHLATPKILLPAHEASRAQLVADKPFKGRAGWLASLTSFSNLVKVGIGLAAAVLVVGIIYLAVYLAAVSPAGKSEIAANIVKSVDSPSSKPAVVAKTESSEPVSGDVDEPTKYAGTQPKHLTPTEPVAQQVKALRSKNRPSTDAKVQKPETAANRNAPRLNSFGEEEDRSLRLSDLFAEVGNGGDE